MLQYTHRKNISKGQSTPHNAWYDQDEGEFVMVLEGHAILEFEDDRMVTLQSGDYLNRLNGPTRIR